jgi:hypothetical protein
MISQKTLLQSIFSIKNPYCDEKSLTKHRKPFILNVDTPTNLWLDFEGLEMVSNITRNCESVMDVDALSDSILCHLQYEYKSIVLVTDESIQNSDYFKCDVAVFKMDNYKMFDHYLHYASHLLKPNGGIVYFVTVFPCVVFMVIQIPQIYNLQLQYKRNNLKSMYILQKHCNEYFIQHQRPIFKKYEHYQQSNLKIQIPTNDNDCDHNMICDSPVYKCDSPVYMCDSPEYKE